MTTGIKIYTESISTGEYGFLAYYACNRDREGKAAKAIYHFHVAETQGWDRHQGVMIERLQDGAVGYILNCGPKIVTVRYERAETGLSVGPLTDHILPGQFKEIGAAKGIIWRVKEA